MANCSELRFADGVVDTKRNRLVTVQEDHSGKGEAVNTIAAVGMFICIFSFKSVSVIVHDIYLYL